MNLPHDIAAERTVLGFPLVDPSCLDGLAEMDAADFFMPVNRELFESLMAIRKRGERPDPLLVLDEMKTRGAAGKLDGGLAHIDAIADEAAAAFGFRSYARIVADKAIRRRMIVACSELASRAQDEESPISDTVDDARKRMAEIISRGGSDGRTLTDLVPEVLDDIEQRARLYKETGSEIVGIPFGVPGLDSALLGMQAGDLGIVAADTSGGKTSLVMQAVIGHVLKGGDALVVNLEMPAKQIAERALIHAARLDSRLVRFGKLDIEEWQRLQRQASRLVQTRCVVKDDVSTMVQITSGARRWRARHPDGVGLFVVDFVQLIRSVERKMTRAQEIGTFAQDLKSLAKELKIAIVLISQFNRVGVKSDRPSKSDLKESGDLENAADWIVIVHNTSEQPIGDDPVTFYVDKNRNGAKAQASGWWTGRHYLFTDERETTWTR